MTKQNKLSSHKRLIIGAFFAIMIAVLFIASSVPATAGTGHQQETGFTTTVNYIPSPQLNSNVSWSTFYHGWQAIEYNNGTLKGNKTLNAHLSTVYANPITVNPAKITGITGTYKPATDLTTWKAGSGITGALGNIETNTNSTGLLTISTNGTNLKVVNFAMHIEIPTTALPYNNAQYDYINFIVNSTGKEITGESLTAYITNATNHETYDDPAFSTTLQATGDKFYSISIGSLTHDTAKYGDMNLSKNAFYKFGIGIKLPAGTGTDRQSTTVQYVSITSSPMYLGASTTNNEITNGSGLIHLSTFSPDFTWKTINNGYTVAVSQNMQNETESQTSINNGVYTEQATYQGLMQLPVAPDLSYSNSYISMQLNETGKQFSVANMNGISYLTAIQSKTNGTFVFGTVEPTNENTVIIEVEYTTAQWNASTSAPSFFSVQGLEYYWWVGLIGLMSVIGLGAAANSHFSGEEENLKIPKGKFGR